MDTGRQTQRCPQVSKLQKEEASGTPANLEKRVNLLPLVPIPACSTFSCERVNCHTLFTVSRTPRRQSSSLPVLELRRPLVSLLPLQWRSRPLEVIKPLGVFPRRSVPASLNAENKIVGIGYNGMPNGCSDDLLPWRRTAENILDTRVPLR